MKAFNIIKKNFRVLLRSRSSALIILVGPLLVMFLVGLAFNDAASYNIRIGHYSTEYSDLTHSFLDTLSEKYVVQQYTDKATCLDDVKLSDIHACIEFPPRLGIGGDVQEIQFYVDESRINLVEAVVNTLTELISKRSGEISTELTTVLVDTLLETQDAVKTGNKDVLELQSGNEQLMNDVTIIEEQLSALDLEVKSESFKVTELEDRIGELEQLGLDATSISTDKLKEIRTKVKNLNTSTSARNEIYTIIDATIDDMNNLSAHMSNLTNASDLDAINWLLYNINQNIERVQGKLAAVETARGVVNDEKIPEMNEALENSKNKLTSLSTALQSIDESINDIQVKDAEKIVSPVKVKISPVAQHKRLNYLVPTLLMIVIMFVSILLSTTLVIMEKISNAQFRNSITPTKYGSFFVSTFFTSVFIVTIQLLIMLGINALFFQAYLDWVQFSGLLSISIAVIALFSLVGMIIGEFFQSEETATLAAVSAGSVFLFVSSTILPLESIPQYIMRIAQYNPYVLADSLIKKVYLFNTPLSAVSTEIYLVLGYVMVLLILTLLLHSLLKTRWLSSMATRGFLKKQRKLLQKEVKQQISTLPSYAGKQDHEDKYKQMHQHKVQKKSKKGK